MEENMKKNRFLVVVAVLAVLCFPLFAGGETETTDAAEASSTEPQYGGTLTLGMAQIDPPTADTVEGMWPTTMYTSFVLDYLLCGDIDKFGPRGSNEFAFTSPLSVPEEFTKGGVIEDWEVTPNKIIFHIRPGVMWAAVGKEHVMESREFVAEDVVFSLMRFWTAPNMGWLEANEFPDWLIGMYAETSTPLLSNSSISTQCGGAVLVLVGQMIYMPLRWWKPALTTGTIS